MKRISRIVFLVLLALFSASAQTSTSTADRDLILSLVKDVQAQQGQIVANQTKIEAKLAEVAEAIRVAPLYSTRAR